MAYSFATLLTIFDFGAMLSLWALNGINTSKFKVHRVAKSTF